TVAVRTPAKIRRIDGLAHADLGQPALRPAQWRNQSQFTLGEFRFAAQESDPAAVRRPDRVVIVARVGRQPQGRGGADLLHINIRVVLLGPVPRESDVAAIRRKRGIAFYAG